MKKLYTKAKNFFDKYEKYLMPLTMIIGFTVDSLTLKRIDLIFDNLIIIAYLLLAVLSIIYVNTYKKKLFQNQFLAWLGLITPFIMQYAFGALFSAFTVFYFRSSTLIVSWPFLLILLSLLLGNELFRKRYERLTFHLSILYIAFFAYSVFALPILVNNIGRLVFVGSGIMSLILIGLVIFALYKIDNQAIKQRRHKFIFSLGTIYLIFNIFYFANIIPPIPLAMKSAGIYHSVRRVGNDYNLSFEKPHWYEFWRETSATYHWQPGQRIYIFTAIFAPTKFKEQIFHRWLYYDVTKHEWIEKNKLSFSIAGGSDHGYRGYSYKSTVEPGNWRVDVVTDTDQILGRIKFEVELATEKIKLEQN